MRFATCHVCDYETEADADTAYDGLYLCPRCLTKWRYEFGRHPSASAYVWVRVVLREPSPLELLERLSR